MTSEEEKNKIPIRFPIFIFQIFISVVLKSKTINNKKK